MNQTLKKFYKGIGTYSPLGKHETHQSTRTYRRYQVKPKTSPGARNNRGLTAFSPRRATMKIGTNASLISKIDISFKTTRHCLDFRKLLLEPSFNCFRILLIGSPHRPLGAKPHLVEQPADRTAAQSNIKFFINQSGHHGRCPQGKLKFQLQRILHRNGIVNPAQGTPIQLGGTTSTLFRVQLLPAPLTISCQPSVNRCTRNTHNTRNKFWALSSLNRCHSLLSQLCQPLVIQLSCIMFFHVRRVA